MTVSETILGAFVRGARLTVAFQTGVQVPDPTDAAAPGGTDPDGAEAAGESTGGEAVGETGQETGLDVEPLIPEEGLLESETWVGLGERLLAGFIDLLPGLLAALVVLVIFLAVSSLASRLLGKVLERSRVDPGLSQILRPLVKYTILGFGVIMAASQAGLEVGSLLAGVGVAGLAVGLAAQDSLGNFISGVTILLDRPFRVGDRVTIEGTYGQVTHIGLRSVRLRTLEKLDVIFPNREVINSTIVNHTETPDLRLGVPLSIGYREDVREARAALLDGVAGIDGVRREPPPEVVVTALADSGVSLELRLWLEDAANERRMLFEALEVAKRALDEAGIEIPFPQRTLHWATQERSVSIEASGREERGRQERGSGERAGDGSG